MTATITTITRGNHLTLGYQGDDGTFSESVTQEFSTARDARLAANFIQLVATLTGTVTDIKERRYKEVKE